MTVLPTRRVVLYKHGVGYFEREGKVEGETTVSLTFKQSEVSDVLKSLTVLDLDGGHISSVSYDSTKPIEQLLADVALHISDRESLVGLIPQLKGARVALHTGVSDPVEGNLLGVDTTQRHTGDGTVSIVLVSVVTESGSVRSFDLHGLASLQILDDALRSDLDFYLRTKLSATKKDARTFTFFAQGKGQRTIRLSYTLAAPVWKATYRIVLGNKDEKPLIQGWAVVDNTQDEDWQDVRLSLISGLPVSFVHDLYTPRYVQRPVVKVKDTTGVLPPELEEGYDLDAVEGTYRQWEESPEQALIGAVFDDDSTHSAGQRAAAKKARHMHFARAASPEQLKASVQTQVREQVLGDLLEYEIEHPVTIRRNQSALVPIVQRAFDGKPVLLYNKTSRRENPMSAVLFKNTTGLTLEGGPVTVLQDGSYVGEAMLETIKPSEERIVPYAVELSVAVTDTFKSHRDNVHRVVIRDGILTTFYAQVVTTTYTLKNKGEKQYSFYLEHPRLPEGEQKRREEWALVDTPRPTQTTDNFWRFKFTLEPQKTVSFKAKQQLTLDRTYGLSDLTLKTLAFWSKQRFVDEPTKKVLHEVVKYREEEGKLAEAVDQLEKERNDIYTAQKRIRENLDSLGDRASEKELRERFVKTLNKQEDRLEEIDRAIKERAKTQAKCRDQIRVMLAKLEYEASIESK